LSKPAAPPLTLGFVLNDVARLFRKRFDQNGRIHGLTRTQWQVLSRLVRCEGCQQSALAEMLELEPITLVRILDRLEDAGLIERRRHPTDRRIRQIYLHESAHSLVEAMWDVGELTRNEAFVGLSDADAGHLLRILETMKDNLVEACGTPPAAAHVRQDASVE
jgi:MarR family transcriptional regulator for hemolysin